MSTSPPDDQTLLDALRNTGLRLVHAVDDSLDDSPTPAGLAALGATYDRAGRGIRRTIAFCRRLDEPAADPAAKRVADAKRTADRRRIIHTVEDAIERTRAPTDAESLRAELYERLETSELDEDLDHLPAEQAIEQILRDFGLANLSFTPPYPRRTPAHIAAIAARAAGQPVPPVPDPPEPADPSNDAAASVDSILAWDARRRRPSPLAP